MVVNFVPMTRNAELDELLERSQHDTAILFNHDPWCPISSRAYDEMRQVPAEVVIVDVSVEHDLVDRIERVTGVRHESPQVIILRRARPAWSASHHEITADAVRQAIAAQG